MIHVVAGVVIDADGRVLIAQRLPGKHLAGGWEFPGGKLEPGEVRTVALARELKEEIGITIAAPRPLMRLTHRYPYGDVLLDAFIVRHYTGEPTGVDGQNIRWLSQAALSTADLLPADRPIVAALRLPERLKFASSPDYRVNEMSALKYPGSMAPGAPRDARLHGMYCADAGEAAVAVAGGADFLVLRAALPDAELAALCAAVFVPVFAVGVELAAAWALGASGVNVIQPASGERQRRA